jgi:hypothetical protein
MFRTFYGRFVSPRLVFFFMSSCECWFPVLHLPEKTHILQAGNGRVNKSNAMATSAWD